MLNATHKIAYVSSVPVRLLTRAIFGADHKLHPVAREVGHLSVAVVVVFTGAGLAQLHVVPEAWHALHFMWDGFAYTIHGIGLTPIAEKVLGGLKKLSEAYDAQDAAEKGDE